MVERRTCQQPDRDVPSLVCGYPLPCPHHTFVIDGSSVVVPEAAPGGAVERVRKVARALTGADVDAAVKKLSRSRK